MLNKIILTILLVILLVAVILGILAFSIINSKGIQIKQRYNNFTLKIFGIALFCAGPGETVRSDAYIGPERCCSGLKEIAEDLNNCQPTALGGWAKICSNCGNGKCEKWETHCNCPEDCK